MHSKLKEEAKRLIDDLSSSESIEVQLEPLIEFLKDVYSAFESVDKPAEIREEILWAGELMYKHRGQTAPRFQDLGFVGSTTKADAIQKSKDISGDFILENFLDNEIEWWEVRVRPTAGPTS